MWCVCGSTPDRVSRSVDVDALSSPAALSTGDVLLHFGFLKSGEHGALRLPRESYMTFSQFPSCHAHTRTVDRGHRALLPRNILYNVLAERRAEQRVPGRSLGNGGTKACLSV
jgi:hypothetical protein